MELRRALKRSGVSDPIASREDEFGQPVQSDELAQPDPPDPPEPT